MDQEFWHERWKNKQIGFHQEEVHISLERFWPSMMGVDEGVGIFIPLCGKTRDIFYFLERGHRVTANELSPIAVSELFSENGLEPVIQKEEHFERYVKDELVVYCGDFFDLRPEQLQGVDAVYDRASLVALPPTMRPRYANHMADLLSPGARILLVSFQYDQEKMAGPPFSVPQAEVLKLYGENFTIQVLESKEILSENPSFRKRGLDAIHEITYGLTRL